MADIFILWSGEDGQTHRIAQAIEKVARDGGHRLEVLNADEPSVRPIFSAVDAVAVVAWGEGGEYSQELRTLLRRVRHRLPGTPSAFLSVSVTAAVPGRDAEARQWASAFLADIGWSPAIALSEAGALRYPEYGFRQRRAMRRLAKKLGLPKDTSRVHEFTDWARVRAFAAQVVQLATGSTAEHVPAQAGSLIGSHGT